MPHAPRRPPPARPAQPEPGADAWLSCHALCPGSFAGLEPRETLRAAMLFAHVLDVGYANTMEIARKFQLNDAHVRRIMRCGYLAPNPAQQRALLSFR